ncbi:MAG: LPS-assembly protein LptD [bacterium]|nr:LPS-assembly protein LptD [bacterium]
MKQITIIIIILTVWLQGIGLAQSVKGAPYVHADEQRLTEKGIIAWGNVELSWDEYRIYADYMEYNGETRVVIAKGRVTMSSNETVISGDKLEFNLKDRTGVLYDTYGQMPPSVRYNTDKLTQVDNETLTFDKIDFTSCNQCVPRWKLTCSKGKIKKEKYIEMKNVVLKIKKIPVFYIPYLRYPLDSDGRASGFLFPGLGRSSLRGFFFLNSFFWAPRKNFDLTLGFDYYQRAGFGASQELRYLFRSMEGNVKFYYFKYKPEVVLEVGETVPEDTFYSTNTSDFYLKMSHKQKIDFLNTQVIVNIDKQSDANFLRLFSNDFDSVLRRTSRSSISVTSSLGNVKLALNASQFDTFYTFNNSSRSLRYLPKVVFNWNQQKIWKIPGYFSLNANYSSVQRIGKSFDIEEGEFVTDIRSQRLTIRPTYNLSLMKTPWANTTLTLSSKQSFYPKSRDPETKDILEESLHLGFSTAKLVFKGPVFGKIYESRNSKLKHVITPTITMRYITKIPDEELSRVIPIDSFDYPSYSFVGFSLSNKLLYKKNNSKTPKEVFSYTISQDYYFDPALASRNRKIGGVIPDFSELKNTIRIRPFKSFSVDATLSYNHFLNADSFIDNFASLRFNLSYTNKKSPVYGRFSYSRYINPFASANYIFNRDIVGGSLNFDIPRFPLKLNSNVNYDITAKEFRHATFKLSYDYQCIQFLTELRLFKYSGRIETQFNIGISFGNLGTVKDFLGVDDK